MTPAHTDTPLRRSEANNFREGSHVSTTINDDEAERRESRRRTLMSLSGDSAMHEENETLKKCLEIYNGNKLSKDNAWSVSLIDTLSTLLDRHHKSLNNFGVAGSSLEASSKVYSLRVDSIHTAVLRMSAGLNAQKFSERQNEEDDDVATGGEGGNDPNDSAAGVEAVDTGKQAPRNKPKKQRKVMSTVTKNKDTINARLDTVPLQDPVFGKLNSTVGSVNSSNRLMNNILLTTGGELLLRTTFPVWDAQVLPECDYTEECVLNTENDEELAACDRLFKMSGYEDMELRPMHGGYIICDTPEPSDDKDDDLMPRRMSFGSDVDDGPPGCADGGGTEFFDPFLNTNEMGMAFDINAECEPMPALSVHMPITAVNYDQMNDLSTEERNAIGHCGGLRKAPVLIDDLRPVDSTSKLEYSYRPLDKISQFWAGPSHWKFRKSRRTRTTFTQMENAEVDGLSVRPMNARSRAAKRAQEKIKNKMLTFGNCRSETFLKLDENYRSRKANIQKKWDQRKLKLPKDLRIDPDSFQQFNFSPALRVQVKQDKNLCAPASTSLRGGAAENSTCVGGTVATPDDEHFNDGNDGGGADDCMNFDEPMDTCDGNNISGSELHAIASAVGPDGVDGDEGGHANDTILEIATDFDGAPSQVTKVVVPFAKRAKVIDMKNLKRSCTALLNKQFKNSVNTEDLPQHPILKKENYESGMASFHDIYEHLPEILPKQMAEAISTSIAFYSVLHLANEYDLRLIPQEDLKDFKIRKVTG